MLFAHGHALLIGIGSYQHAPQMDVPVTASDAQALKEILCDAQLCGYPTEQVTLLHDADATRERILSALSRLAESTGPDDTVFLFYCGHGDYGDDGSYYLTSHDTQLANRKIVGGSGVSHQELLLRLKNLPARRALLIFNACHAGAIMPTLDGEVPFVGRSLPDQFTGALLATGEGRVIVTACRERQYSFVGDGERTIFTQALIDGLRGKASSSRNGYISVFDLYTYLYFAVSDALRQRVPEAARVRYGGIQEPELTILKGVGPFAVALSSTAKAIADGPVLERSISSTAVRDVDLAETQALLRQIQHDGINFGQHTAVSVRGSVVGSDQYNITDQRQGISVSGGTIQGPMIGFNQGSLVISDMRLGIDASDDPLRHSLMLAQQAAAQAERQGDGDLALDLQGVIVSLQAALKACEEGKTGRQNAKFHQAYSAVQHLAADRPALCKLLRSLASLGPLPESSSSSG